MPQLTIASFNTHYGFRTRPSPPQTPFDVQGAIRELDARADVIVIQEFWRPDATRGPVDDAAAELGLALEHEPTGRATRMTEWPRLAVRGEGTVGIAVLTRLPMRRVGTIGLGPTPGDPAPARTALHVEVDVDGTALQLVAVHLTSRLPHGPVLQLRRLAAGAPREHPAVIVGDCNLWGPPVRILLRGWRRAVRGRTWPARMPHSQIDHILVRPGMEVVDAAVLPATGSDHRPIRARIAW